MPRPTYTLYVPEASFRAFAILIAAEYNGVTINVNTDLTNASKSPVRKLPILELMDGTCIFSSQSATRYVASIRHDTGLMGKSVGDAACIDAWMDWCTADVELPSCLWFYPVAGYMPFNQTAYDKAKVDLGNALSVLDAHLLHRTYLVGEQITIADIAIVSTLLYPFKLVTDKNYLKNYTNVTRWFTTCVNQPEFIAVIGTVVMCKKELLAEGQAPAAKAPSAAAPKAAKKEKAPKEDDADLADEPAVVEKKAEHPYKIMDREKPSPFSMDTWKKTYSNASSYAEAMAEFWKMFDSEGWTLWYQTYNYNEDNKRIFMTANAIGGFQQRTDEIRKWAFGVQDVLGTEETVLEIAGVWLLRGDTVDHMKEANDDANWYTWKALSVAGQPVSDENKALVETFWTAEDQIDGKPIQDSKVFK